jgi:hypothetical protein
MRPSFAAFSLLLAIPAVASADPTAHPYAGDHFGPKRIVLDAASMADKRYVSGPVEQPDLARLNEVHSASAETPAAPALPGRAVLPPEVESGELTITPDAIFATEDIPGNKYPRKHTLFLNFNGGMLTNGADNSAENKSTLAKNEVYPTYTGGESQAIAIAQAAAVDVADYGINVVYIERPPKILPYTMGMIGGDWEDTNIDSPAGGVAPGADCGALGQRHVVYTFSTQATVAANTNSQEAGHAWGLDHTFNCNSVMSYCTGGDADFQSSCDMLCESQCQGPNSAGCQLTHEMFCGEGSFQQNDAMELAWIFGGNEPDMEAPTVEIVEPAEEEITLEIVDAAQGVSVDILTDIDDNYGGFGWSYMIEQDGEVVLDAVDYERLVQQDTYYAHFPIAFVEPGEYVVTVTVQDHFEHVTTDQVTIHVVGMGQADGTTTDPTATSGPSTTSADDGSGSETDGSSGPPIDDGADDEGCGCTAGARAPWSLALCGLIALAVRRRREVDRA